MTLARPKNPRDRNSSDDAEEISVSDAESQGSKSHARQRDGELNEFPVEIGEVIDGKYRIERLIGAGGMGLVMAAHDVALDRPVAVKFLHGLNSTTLEANSRFKREARAMAKLHSEHVIRILDVGTLPSGEPYMVMEHLEGVDLAQLVKQRGYLSVPEAVDYMLAACEAVAEAHVLGIVHRDLKPSNLYLARRLDGTNVLKLLDFGIAKIATDATEDAQSFTTTTALLGSPVYMSPEQLQCSRDADARADIWSLGAIVYRLVAGRPPFVANTMPQICTMILTISPQPLTELVAGMPPGLDAAVQRCLEKDPEARFSNVAELARAIAPFGTGRALSSLERAQAIMYSKSGPHGSDPSGELYAYQPSSTGPTPVYVSSSQALARSGQSGPIPPLGSSSRAVAAAAGLDSAPSYSGPIALVSSSPAVPNPRLARTTETPRPTFIARKIAELKTLSFRALVLGSLALSVFLGFFIGLLLWLEGRAGPPPEETNFGEPTAVVPAVPAVPIPTDNARPPAFGPAAPPPVASTTASPAQSVVPVSALPPAPLPGQQRVPPRRYPPPLHPRADNTTPSPPPPAPTPPVDNSEFGGRK
jgi:eukaryotic-like serine/threonine-protein kinase